MTDQPVCEKCGKSTPIAVYHDTAGICRVCQKAIIKSVSLEDLVRVLRGTDKRYCGVYFDNFRKRKPPIDAVPVLREALLLKDYYVSSCAAIALGKLGALARDAIPELLHAANDLDNHGYPQAFEECIKSIVRIDANCPSLIPLIKHHSLVQNWGPIVSLRTLAQIGTPEATQLLQDIRNKWYNNFNKTEKRIADEILGKALSVGLQRTKR
jgi:hypothetical protein